jgi:plasmid stabilization system protein ParE
VAPYVIVYDYADGIVTVLRVLHGKRDITRRLVRGR